MWKFWLYSQFFLLSPGFNLPAWHFTGDGVDCCVRVCSHHVHNACVPRTAGAGWLFENPGWRSRGKAMIKDYRQKQGQHELLHLIKSKSFPSSLSPRQNKALIPCLTLPLFKHQSSYIKCALKCFAGPALPSLIPLWLQAPGQAIWR